MYTLRELFLKKPTFHLFTQGSTSDVKVHPTNASVETTMRQWKEPYLVLHINTSSLGQQQPFGAKIILACADARVNYGLNMKHQGGYLSRHFQKVSRYGIGIQSGIVYKNFNDDLYTDNIHMGFKDGSWINAEFYDRTAIVIQDDDGNRMTLWTTAMRWPANEFIFLSAMGGETRGLNGEKNNIEPGFSKTVSEIMMVTRSDKTEPPEPWLRPDLKQDPNTAYDRRSREKVILEGLQIAMDEMMRLKKGCKGKKPFDVALQLDYTHPTGMATHSMPLCTDRMPVFIAA
jgi:non-canonical (house-cleaning) NTP pyrophosphatase